eukprot:CAMPEP_0206473162 /NCGR_PEP_ID=MMETSP0324_2-20121206/32676_1 /ASSEMBLY_ACC=CAM_ASM_000836 /TAXON_ID=2866 /ORGANISM="Crypthecodinium cohnii, Strain Seligo" /LENGTH=322 /DNA_ID=CAMNT_0053947989 /DNA_START=97 /DNA_END=1063 /DNA_ORIENTATION=+
MDRRFELEMQGPMMDEDGCGGPRGCFADEACMEGPSDPYSYVGQGRGGYEKVETLVWVGEGNGTYSKEDVINKSGGGRRSSCYVAVMMTLLGLGAACIVSSALSPNVSNAREQASLSVASQRRQASDDTAVAGEYQCNSATVDSWELKEKVWCCQMLGKGCPTMDCTAGYNDWQRGWSPGKKKWCCKHEGKACEETGDSSGVVPVALPAPAYDCVSQYYNWEQAWATTKKPGAAGILVGAAPPSLRMGQSSIVTQRRSGLNRRQLGAANTRGLAAESKEQLQYDFEPAAEPSFEQQLPLPQSLSSKESRLQSSTLSFLFSLY